MVVKRVFKYLHGAIDYKICYEEILVEEIILDIHDFVNTKLVGDVNCRRSTRGYGFNLFGGIISSMRKRQFVVALSASKFEYMATTCVSKKVVWL